MTDPHLSTREKGASVSDSSLEARLEALERQLKIEIPVSAAELEQVKLAASLRHMSLRWYVVRAINQSLRSEGVDSVLLREKGDR